MTGQHSTVDGLGRDAESTQDSSAGMLRGPSGLSVAQAAAENEHVCTRPMAMRRTDTDTGSSRVVAVACGATREAVCGPCARRHRRLRVEQCRQGWHLEAEPDTGRREPDREQTALMGYRADLLTLGREALEANEPGHVADVREALAEVDGALRDAGVTSRLPGFDEIEHPAPSHRGRSTRRRADIPDLPRRPVRGETIGQTYAGGRYRPSLFATLTLPSYGPVHSARWRGGRIVRCGCGQTHRPDSPVLGTPVDPDSYDYARAARDAIHFSSLVDRFWQNLRRAVGWNVQYFAAVEPQKRLTPHLHTAIRGTVPRALLGQVVAGTYHHVWWPQHDHPVYGGERLPVWNPDASAWCDPDTRRALPTWEESLPVPDAEPADAAHTVRFGAQTDVRGVLGGSTEAERHTRYLTKYLTKSVGETHTATHSAQREHARRLLDALAVTPCSPRCGVWLLYGIQPRGASSRTHPGQCRGKAHQPHALGVAGRRVLVSRAWTGKTLPQHAETRRAHVRATLTAGGVLPEGGDQPARSFGNSGERASPGATWERIRPGDSDVPPRPLLILDSIARRRRSRADYQAAQHALALTDDAADGGV